jgi:hypothetical protein
MTAWSNFESRSLISIFLANLGQLKKAGGQHGQVVYRQTEGNYDSTGGKKRRKQLT